MEAISKSNLTLNSAKCSFGKRKILFWSMVISADGIFPDHSKVEALINLPPPRNNEELKSFICMMQSNSSFIPNLSRLIAPLRDLQHSKTRFQWLPVHQHIFGKVLEDFKKDALLSYFDLGKNTYIFTDAHKTGIGAILAQGESMEDARHVAFSSQCTKKFEKTPNSTLKH